jgi:hypothetical protein
MGRVSIWTNAPVLPVACCLLAFNYSENSSAKSLSKIAKNHQDRELVAQKCIVARPKCRRQMTAALVK